MTASTVRLTLRAGRSRTSLQAALLFFAALPAAVAQVVLDGKFGTTGPLTGPNYSVPASVGAIRGNNLFHSFSQFDLKAGEAAAFSGPANIQNILSRVTGPGASMIDGTIRSEIAGANFFFMNPNGVIFGPNAKVDVSGAFAATTANYLALADGGRFTAALDADDSTLTSGPVAAFGFLNLESGSIQVNGSLKAAAGGSISLVGGSVTVGDGARVEVPNGQINLTGAKGPGEVPFASSSPQPIHLQETGAANAGPAAADGTIVIRGGKLVMDNAQVAVRSSNGNVDIAMSQSVEVANGAQVTTTSTGGAKGGDILISAPSVLVDGRDGPAPGRIAAETISDVVEGKGGDVIIKADSVALRRGAEISVSSSGAADAGRMDITTSSLTLMGSESAQYPTLLTANAAPFVGTQAGAGGRINIHADSIEAGNGAGMQAATFGDADAGTITIEARSLTLNNGGIGTSTGGAGKGGEIQIRSDTITLDGPFASITALTAGVNGPRPAGNGGVIAIEAKSLRLLNDGAISATTVGDAKGGDVRITAGSMVLDTATTVSPFVIPGITASSKPPFFGEGAGGGKGGDIDVTAGSLTLRNGMLISASTSTPGDGGSVRVRAGSLLMDSRSSIQSASFGSGKAGTLSVNSDGNLSLSEGSTISTSALQSSGGDIQVTAGGSVSLQDSEITAQAGPGGGGNITVTSPSLIYLLRGTLTAQAVGDGGNLNVRSTYFILNEAALVSKSSSANGGNITIDSDLFLQSSSIIDASAPFGLPGTVRVTAPEVDLSGSLIALPSNLLGLETQLRPDCGVRLSGNISSFIVLGRGGLPMAPGGFVPSEAPAPGNGK